jgi:hypothetical protein
MSGLHLVLATIHMRFTIGIEQDKIELVTLNTIFNVVWVGLIIKVRFVKNPHLDFVLQILLLKEFS